MQDNHSKTWKGAPSQQLGAKVLFLGIFICLTTLGKLLFSLSPSIVISLSSNDFGKSLLGLVLFHSAHLEGLAFRVLFLWHQSTPGSSLLSVIVF